MAPPNEDMAAFEAVPAYGRKRLHGSAMVDDGRFEDEEFIKSLAKGLAVIESFGPDYREMNLTTVAKRNGLSPGSARRVLNTLSKLGYVWMKDQRYGLSARALRLGYSYLSSQPIVNLVQPRLSELSGSLNESCALTILDGTDAVCIARATARRLERDYMSVGSRWPAHATSTGKVLLGALSRAEILRALRRTAHAAGRHAVHRHRPAGAAAAGRQGAAGWLELHQPGDGARDRFARGADPRRGRDPAMRSASARK